MTAPENSPYVCKDEANGITVTVSLKVENEIIEILILRTQHARPSLVKLVIRNNNSMIRIEDLNGNGYSEFPENPMHRKGYGTLAVNLAIQFLQRLPCQHKTIGGVVSQSTDLFLSKEMQKKLEDDRRGFWESFGLKVGTTAITSNSYPELSGVFSDLRVVRGKTVEGLFPCDLSFAELFPHFR